MEFLSFSLILGSDFAHWTLGSSTPNKFIKHVWGFIFEFHSIKYWTCCLVKALFFKWTQSTDSFKSAPNCSFGQVVAPCSRMRVSWFRAPKLLRIHLPKGAAAFLEFRPCNAPWSPWVPMAYVQRRCRAWHIWEKSGRKMRCWRRRWHFGAEKFFFVSRLGTLDKFGGNSLHIHTYIYIVVDETWLVM